MGDVGYHVGGTFTYVDNELIDNGGSGALAAGIRSDREGYPLGSVFGLRYCGKIQNEEQLAKYKDKYRDNSSVGNIRMLRVGDNMFQDINGDGKLDAEDYVYLGTDAPKSSSRSTSAPTGKDSTSTLSSREQASAPCSAAKATATPTHGRYLCVLRT